MLTPLDESFMHQAPVPFELAATSDHRFFDRTVVTAASRDGSAGVVLGLAAYKNMDVMDGFAAVQIDHARQHNLRLSRALRPDMSQTLGPLRMEVVEPFKTIRYILEEGAAPFAFDLAFHAFLEPVLEDPHFHRARGRITQDYVRFNQLMSVEGALSIEGRDIAVDKWFGWRDHSWGVRPGVGGFEPPSPDVNDAFPSAARAGGKGMMLWYVGFNVDDELGGGLQTIENGAGDPIYSTGHMGARDRQSPVVSYDWEVECFPGSRMPRRLAFRAKTADGENYDVVAEPTARSWAYKGFGYDAGYDDGKGQGVWRSADLHSEQDCYDLSDVEGIGMPDGSTARPNHRETHVRVTVNGREGYGYMPFIAIGDIAKLSNGADG
jgi:hypothetical protein